MAVYLLLLLIVLYSLYYTARLVTAEIRRGAAAVVYCPPLSENNAEYTLRSLLFSCPHAEIVVPSGCEGEKIARMLSRTESRISVL